MVLLGRKSLFCRYPKVAARLPLCPFPTCGSWDITGTCSAQRFLLIQGCEDTGGWWSLPGPGRVGLARAWNSRFPETLPRPDPNLLRADYSSCIRAAWVLTQRGALGTRWGHIWGPSQAGSGLSVEACRTTARGDCGQPLWPLLCSVELVRKQQGVGSSPGFIGRAAAAPRRRYWASWW